MEDDFDIDPWEAFASMGSPKPANPQRVEELTPKQAVIARALIHKGVVIWAGIPEHIIDELHLAGYKIKKSKKLLGRRPQ